METADSAKAKGNEYMAKKEYEEAIKWYGKGIELDPANHVMYSNRSAAYLSAGKAAEALEDAVKCIELNPTWPKGYCRKGAALQVLKQYDEAVATFEEGLKKCGPNDMIQRGLDEARQKLSSGEGERALINQIISFAMTSPALAELRNDPAFLPKLMSLQQHPEKLMSMMGDPQITTVLQTMISGMSTPESASQQQQSEPKSTPKPESKPEPKPEPKPEISEEEKMVMTLKEEGNALYKKKNFDAAMEKYKAILEIQPNNIAIRNNICAVLLEQGNFDECVKKCQETITLAREIRASFEDVAKVITAV